MYAQTPSSQNISITNSKVTIINNYSPENSGVFEDREVSQAEDAVSTKKQACTEMLGYQKRSNTLSKGHFETKKLFEYEISDGKLDLTEDQQGRLAKLNEEIEANWDKIKKTAKAFIEKAEKRPLLMPSLCENMRILVNNFDLRTRQYYELVQEVVKANNAKLEAEKTEDTEIEAMMRDLSLETDKQVAVVDDISSRLAGQPRSIVNRIVVPQVAGNHWFYNYMLERVTNIFWWSSPNK